MQRGLPTFVVLLIAVALFQLCPAFKLTFAARDESLEVDEPSEAAREASSNVESLPSLDLLILVPSHADEDVTERLTIRKTWGQYLNTSEVNCTTCAGHKAQVVFVVGKEGNDTAVSEEKKTYKDIGVLEDYKQLRGRENEAEMVQRSIRYAVEHFKFKLLLKVSVHSWVFVDRVMGFANTQHLFDRNVSLPGVYGGNFPTDAGSAAVRLEDNRSGVLLPTYARGDAFLLTPDLCEFIAGMGAATEDTSGAPKWGDDYGWAPVPRLISLPTESLAVGFWLQVVNHTKIPMDIALGNEACTTEHGHSVLVDSEQRTLGMELRWFGFVKKGDICHFELEKAKENAKKKANDNFAVQLDSDKETTQLVAQANANSRTSSTSLRGSSAKGLFEMASDAYLAAIGRW